MNTIEKFIIDLSKKGVKSHCYLILQLLVQPDGSLISAKGLEYDGPDLNYQSAGIVLLSAIYEPFTLGTIPIHGGLYRWRENSLPIFLFQKLKEILTRYSRTILTPSKN